MRKQLRLMLAVCGLTVALLLLPLQGEGAALGGVVHSYSQGFDNCQDQPAAFYDDWWSHSPYKNLEGYLGGVNVTCPPVYQSAAWYSHNATKGWGFYLTWVGNQAYCLSGTTHMSTDPATAYTQGGASADAAISKAETFGFSTVPFVLEYDLEAYPNNATCRQVAASYINGWDHELELADVYPSVYGSTCGSYLQDFKSISYPPAILRGANYDGNPRADAFGSCVDSVSWVGSREKQWGQSAHSVTYGTHTLVGSGSSDPALDKDCNDAFVTPSSASTYSDPIC